MHKLIPSVNRRMPNRIEFLIRNGPSEILHYQVLAADKLDDAYGPDNGVGGLGAEEMFEFRNRRSFISKGLRESRLANFGNPNRRGLTQAIFDPDEFATDANRIPFDKQTGFYRIREFDGSTNTYGDLGPIIVVPPPDFFQTTSPILTLTATTPAVPGYTAGDYPPPEAMNFYVPHHTQRIGIKNLDLDEPFYVSFGDGIPMREVAPGESIANQARVPQMFVVGLTNVRFSINYTIDANN